MQFVKPPHPFPAAEHFASMRGANAIVFGAPHGTPYRGIDNGVHAASADAIRQALAEDGRWTDHWDFDLDGPLLAGRDFRLGDLGNLATTPDDGPGNRAKIEATTRAILAAGAVPLMIGGDDSVPIPFIAGFSAHGPMTIVQIDAHIDWREERRGERFGYSSTMRRASEMAHVQRIVQVGIRGLGSAREQEVRDARAWGAQIVTARQIHARGIAAALDLIPPGGNCLITLDCDAIDGAAMPAVMAPTPGGLSYVQIIDLLAGIAGKARIAGFDLIEFVPGRDRGGYAAYVAGRILINVVGALARASSR